MMCQNPNSVMYGIGFDRADLVLQMYGWVL